MWEYALQHATYIRNRIPRRGAKVTPYKSVFGQRPDVGHLPIFGQAVVARVPDQLRRKKRRFLDTRGQLGAFIGCAEDIKEFYVYTKGSNRSIFTSRDVNVIDRMLFEVDPSAKKTTSSMTRIRTAEQIKSDKLRMTAKARSRQS